MDLVHVVIEDPGHFLEWYEGSGRLYLRVRQRPSKPSIVQKSQSQRTQFSWTCTGLRTFERDNLAVFCLSNVSQRTKTCDRDSERPTAEDGAIEGDRRPCKFISETSANDKGRDSVSSYQKNSSNNESDSADKDRSQDQSYTTNNSTDNQNVQDGHSDNEDGGGAEGSQDHDAEHAKINKLIEKIEKSLETRRKILDEHTQSWIHSLWGYIDFITPAQWDFDSLLDSAESDPFRIVLHKLRLHWNLKARTEQGALHGCASNRYIRQYKNEMIRESPSFRALDSRRQEAKRRLFELYLRQGEVFDRMCLLCPGLVGLVAPILTTLETQTVSSHFQKFSASWNASSVCSIAARFSDVVLAAEPQIQARQREKRMRETSELDLRSSKRREMCYGLAKSPPLPPNSDITHITLEETQSRRLGQNQQSPASRTPSLEHLIHTNPAPSLLPNVNSPKYDGPHSVSGDGMATDGIAHQSFGHLDPASSQSNPADGSCGAFLTQHLQYARQPGAPPNPQQGGRNLEPDNVLAAETSDLGSGAGPSAGIGDNYAHYFPESDNIFRTEAPGLGPLAGPTAGTINNYFPVSDNVFRAENPDEGSGPGAAAGTGNNYAHYFPDPDDVSRTEAPGAGSGPGLIADSGDNYAHYFPELHEGDRGVYEGNCAGEPSSITWLTSQ